MLGMRGVRLGITIPEIYDMQARAIFEATVEASRRWRPGGARDHDPAGQRHARGRDWSRPASTRWPRRCASRPRSEFDYRLGVMVETPRAALRAADIAQHAAFLSFGTNDLTQMTYGLSRDDAGRFMSAYVKQGVYDEDPFHTLDIEGVGELLLDRGRARPAGAARHRPVDLRRAWRQPVGHRILPQTGFRLRVLFAIPGAGSASGGGATGASGADRAGNRGVNWRQNQPERANFSAKTTK